MVDDEAWQMQYATLCTGWVLYSIKEFAIFMTQIISSNILVKSHWQFESNLVVYDFCGT